MITGKKISVKRDRYPLLLTGILLLISLFMSVAKPDMFPRWSNINSMLLQTSEIGLLSAGMALTFLIGGIDLSIVSNAVLSATLAGYVILHFQASGPIFAVFAGIVTAIAVGAAGGAVNGLIIAKWKIPPILATLGTNSLYRGIAVGLTGGVTLGGFTEMFSVIGNGTLFGVYYAFLVFLAVIGCCGIALSYTKGGVLASLLGRNEKAAYFSGIHNVKITIIIYTVTGVIGGIAGIIMMSRSNSINPDYGTSYLLQTILTCVVAGVDINGVSVKITGLFLALLLMQVISTSFNMLMAGYSGATFFKNIIWGVLLIALIIIKYYNLNKKHR